MKREIENQLRTLLSNVYKKGNDGATLEEVMTVLKKELPKITRQEQLVK